MKITSIGWLYGINDTIILTPCIDGASHPTKITITRAEFDKIRHDKNLMKEMAAKLLGSSLNVQTLPLITAH